MSSMSLVYDLEEQLKEGLNPPSTSLEKPPKLLSFANGVGISQIIQYFAIAGFCELRFLLPRVHR